MSIVMSILDILGTVAFSLSGAIEAMKKRMDMLGVLVLGLITAVGGGILRDIFAGNMPFIFRKHVYATASIAGALCYLLLSKIAGTEISTVVSVLLVVVIRILATKYEWNLPRVNLEDNKDNQEVI